MQESIEQHIKNLLSKDKEIQGQSYRYLMEQSKNPVHWAYDVWDKLLYLLKNGDNRARSIAGQLLCNLAKSDPEERIKNDTQKVLDATKDKRFVTARHILQSLWKIGVVNKELLETTIAGLKTRFKDCQDEKACRIIRGDIIIQLRKMYELLKDKSLKEQAVMLLEMEPNEKYRKKYLKEWKDLKSNLKHKNDEKVTSVFFKTYNDFEDFLAKNYDKLDELWVGFYKKGTGRESITWNESVEAAIRFGWIDGLRRSIDKECYTIRFTPRRSNSIWSNKNIITAEKLIDQRKIHPAGMEAFKSRNIEKSGVYSFEQTKVAFSKEFESAFKENKKALSFFQSQTPYYRRTAKHWVMSAKQEKTRIKRLHQLIKESEYKRKVKPLRRKNE